MAVTCGTPWAGQVPFVITDPGGASDGLTTDWVATGIQQFNTTVGRTVWRPRVSDETPYVTFRWLGEGHNSPIGRQTSENQEVQYGRDARSPYRILHHEMGHALGLGHENYHSDWRWWPVLRAAVTTMRADSTARQLQDNVAYRIASRRVDDEDSVYADCGEFDARSIMLYSDESFFTGISRSLIAAIVDDLDLGIRLGEPAFVQNTVLSELDIAAIRDHLNPNAPAITAPVTGTVSTAAATSAGSTTSTSTTGTGTGGGSHAGTVSTSSGSSTSSDPAGKEGKRE